MVQARVGGAAGRRVAVALLLLLLASLPAPAAAQGTLPTILLAYDEAPAGDRIPGLYSGEFGGELTLRRLHLGPMLDVAPSPDRSAWAVLSRDRLVFSEDLGHRFLSDHPLQAASIAWRPEGQSVLAVGEVAGQRGLWELDPSGAHYILDSGDVLAARPLAGGDALIVENVEGGVRTRTYHQYMEVRPHAIDMNLVHENGTSFAEATADGVRLQDVHGAWSLLLDPDLAHKPVRLVGDTLFWTSSTDGYSWGFTRNGVAVTQGTGNLPFTLGAIALEPGGQRALVVVHDGSLRQLLHLSLDPLRTEQAMHVQDDNLRAVAWAGATALPPAPPPVPPPTPRDGRAPERVAFVSPGGSLAAGIWTARLDGTDLRLAYATPAGEAAPTALGQGPPGYLAFLLPSGLRMVRWDGSEPAVPVANGTIRGYAFSPSGNRIVIEEEATGVEGNLRVLEGGQSWPLGPGSVPSFHTEDLLRVVRRAGYPALRTTLIDVGADRTSETIDLVDAAIPPRAFAEASPGFAYARDGHIYAAGDTHERRVVLRQDGSALLDYDGRGYAMAFRVGAPGAYRLGSYLHHETRLLGPAAAAFPAGTFTGNGTGLLVAFEDAGVAALRYFPSITSGDNVTWPTSPQGVRSLVTFHAFPKPDPTAPVGGSRTTLPPIGRTAAVWSGSEVYLFGGWNGTHASAAILRWDPKTDTVTTLPAVLPRPLYGVAAVADDKGVWLIGGTDGTTASDQILRFDGTDVRAVSARLPSPRANVAAAWTGSAVLIAGGEGASGPLGQILLYNPGTGQLQVRPNTISPRAGAAHFYDGSALVLAGGRGPDGPMDSIVKVARDGTAATPAVSRLPGPHDGMAAAWDGGAAYLFGHPAGDGRPLRYDSSGDALLRMTTSLPALREAAAVWTGSKAAILGGHNGTAWTGRVILYEPANDGVEAIPPPGGQTGTGNGTQTGGNTTNPGGNTTNPGGNTTNPGGNTTHPGGNNGGNVTNPGGNTTDPGGNSGGNTGGNAGGGNGTTNQSGNGTANPPATTVVLGQEEAPAPVRGVVKFAPRTGGSYSVRATSAGGKALVLGEGKGDDGVAWDTTRTRNGRYTVTAYDENGTELATAEIIVQNPRSTPTELVVASATGVAVTVGLSALWGHIVNLFGALKGWVLQVGEEEFKDRWRDRAAIGFSLQSGPVWKAGLAMGAMAGVLGISSAYSEASNPEFAWGDFLALLPFVAGTVGVFYAASLVFDHFYARHIGRESEFRIWAPGTAALTASTALFATPFGVPGFVEGSETEDRRLEGRRGLASYLVLLSLTLPFAAAYLWRFDVYETGISTVLMLAVNAAVPVRRMPGALVWRWNKVVWAVVTAGAFALFAVSELALGSPVVFVAAGVAGLLGIVGVFLSHRLLPEGYLEGRRAAVAERAAERAEAEDALQDVAQAAAAGVGPGAEEPAPPEPPEGPR